MDSSAREQFLRQTTRLILERYYETEDSSLMSHPVECRLTFSVRAIELRIDIGRVLERKVPHQHRRLLESVYRDGMTQTDAVRVHSLDVKRPDALFRKIEVALGLELDRLGMREFLEFFNKDDHGG